MTEPIARSNHGPIPHHESWGGTGPTLEETKRAQRPNLKAAGEAVVEHAVDEARDHVIKHDVKHVAKEVGGAALERAVTVAATIYLAVKLTAEAFDVAVVKPAERGEALAYGRDSDAARYVIAKVVQMTDPTILPDGYAAELHHQVVGTGPGAKPFGNPAFKVVGNILGEVANGVPEAVSFRDTMKRCVSEGVAVAHAKNLRTPEALAELREHDPEFEQRWVSDAGFQVGVRAAIWQAQVHPDEFEAANRVRAALQMSLRTVRYA